MTGRDTSRTTSARAEAGIVGVIVATAALALCWWWFGTVVASSTGAGAGAGAEAAANGKQLSAVFDPPRSDVERALNKGDGQIFAGQATDPLARRGLVRGGPTEEAYRAQRPAYGWLGWIASGGGDRDRAPVALMGITVISAGLLGFATARYSLAGGGPAMAGIAVLLLPGLVISLTWIGPEVLGAALVVIGLHAWRAPGRSTDPAAVPWSAVAAFAAAGLCRETLLAIPATLAVVELACRRPVGTARLALSAVPFAVWVLYLRVTVGAWPTGNVPGRLSPVPLGGLVDAAAGWGPATICLAAVTVGFGVFAAAVGGRSGLRPVLLVQLGLATLLGEPVWHRAPDFGRVLLPLGVVSILALATRSGRPGGAPDGPESEREPESESKPEPESELVEPPSSGGPPTPGGHSVAGGSDGQPEWSLS